MSRTRLSSLRVLLLLAAACGAEDPQDSLVHDGRAPDSRDSAGLLPDPPMDMAGGADTRDAAALDAAPSDSAPADALPDTAPTPQCVAVDGGPTLEWAGPCVVSGCPGELLWSVPGGPGAEVLKDIAVDPAGNIVVAGVSNSAKPFVDALTARYSPTGVQTAYVIDAVLPTQIWSGIGTDRDGRAVVAGYFNTGIRDSAWDPPGCVVPMTPQVDGQWHHVAAVTGNGSLRIYLDGVERCIAGGALVASVHHDPLSVSVDGQADDVRIYTRTLTAGEVARLAAGGQ